MDIFLRRVFTESAEKKGKLHCLAFADRLDYTVCGRYPDRLLYSSDALTDSLTVEDALTDSCIQVIP